MRLILLAGLGCSLCGTAAAQAPRPAAPLALAARVSTPADTTVRIRFDIPEQPLARALADFSRQSAVRVRVDLAAASGVRSRPVSGALNSASC